MGENQEARSANVGNATPACPATKLTKEVNSPSAPDVLVLFAKPKRANLDFENCWVILIGNDKPANLELSIMLRFSGGLDWPHSNRRDPAIDYLSFATKRWVVMVNHLNKNKNKNADKV